MKSNSKGPFTVRSVLLSIFFGLFMLFAQGIMGSAAGYFWTGEAALVLMIVGYSLSTLTRDPMTPSELGVIFGAVEVITVLFIGWQYFIPSWALALLSDSIPAEIKQWIPDFLIPKDKEALRTLIVGGSLNLSIWIVPLTFLIVFAVVISLFAYFNMIPFHKFYLEKEKLIFPVATVASSIAKRLKEGRDTKWIWLGVLAGFTMSLIQRGHLLNVLWPDFPVANLNIDLTPALQKVLPGGAFGMDKGSQITPDLVAWAYIIPLEVQASMWITALIAYLAIPPILVKIGLLPYEPGGDFQTYSSVASLHGPLPWHHISTGLLAAIGVVPLLLGYKYIKKSLDDWQGPFNKRILFVGWALTFAGSVALISALGLSPGVAIAILMLQVVYWHGYVWTIGMGNWLIPTELGIRGLVDSLLFTPATRMSRDAFWAGASTAMVSDVGSAQATSLMEGFRYSRNIGMSLKHMFKAQLMGLIMGSVIGGVMLLAAYHIWGAAKEPLRADNVKYPATGLLQITGQFGGWELSYFILGFAFGALIFLIRGVVPWLTVSAVGVLFGLMIPHYAVLYMMSTALRIVVDRTKGREFNRRVMIPLMAGFAAGGIINVMAAGLVKILKVMGADAAALLLGGLIILAVYLLSLRAYLRGESRTRGIRAVVIEPFGILVDKEVEITPYELGVEGLGSIKLSPDDGWTLTPIGTSATVNGEHVPDGSSYRIDGEAEVLIWGVKLSLRVVE